MQKATVKSNWKWRRKCCMTIWFHNGDVLLFGVFLPSFAPYHLWSIFDHSVNRNLSNIDFTKTQLGVLFGIILLAVDSIKWVLSEMQILKCRFFEDRKTLTLRSLFVRSFVRSFVINTKQSGEDFYACVSCGWVLAYSIGLFALGMFV